MQFSALVPYVGHGEGNCLKQEKMMLPSREAERNKAECGGRPASIASVPESSHTCSPLDVPFM